MAIKRKKTSKQILQQVTSGKKALQDPKIVEKKNRRDLTKPTIGGKSNMEKEVYQVIDWMKEGKSHEWCTEQLRNTINENTGRVYAPRFVENIITASSQLINLYYRSQIVQVEKIHIARYNQIIIDKLNKKYEFSERMPEWLCIKIVSDDLNEVLQAMKQKEVLLGMHRKTFKLTINTQNNINISNSQPKAKPNQIDIEKLTLEEQIELMQLIELTSRSEDEVFGVQLRKAKTDQDETVEVVEVINDNIKHIEPFTKPEQNNQGSTLLDIKTTIQQRLLEAAKKQK